MQTRIFSGVYPCGIVYADRDREIAGDYAKLAFLPFSTLLLEIERTCPKDLALEIKRDAAKIQSRRGQQFQISTCGQTVILGKV